MKSEDLKILENTYLPNDLEDNTLEFTKLKFTYFKDFFKRNENSLDLVKIASKYYSLKLTDNFNDFFLKMENSPLFWVLESPILISSEKLLNIASTKQERLIKSEIKKNFIKWITTDEQNQKKFFALSIIKQIDGNLLSVSFLDIIYYSLILIFDQNFKDPDKAIKELEKAQELVEKSVEDIDLRKKILYLVQLYKGYSFLLMNRLEEASDEISSAIDNNPVGITAKFYYAFLSAAKGRKEFTEALIKEIFNYDIDRLQYAINVSDFQMFRYFLSNPVFPNLFFYNEFSSFTQFIKNVLIESNLDSQKNIEELKVKLNSLKNYEYDEYFTEEIRKAIRFLNDFFEEFSQSQSFYIKFSYKLIRQRFNYVLDEILTAIKEKIYENYYRVMNLYKNSLENNQKTIERYQKELEDIKEDINKKLAKSTQQIEEYVKDALWELEEKKKNLNFVSKFDPAASFRSSISYNIFIAIVVFIIGGMAGYFNNTNFFDNNFYMMVGKIILSGTKWSAITFVVGFIVSIFIAGFVFFDRINEKQKIDRMYLELQKEKELSINMIKKEAEQKQKAFSEGYQERIEIYLRKIEEIKKEKEAQHVILTKQAEEQLKPFNDNIVPLYFD